MSYRLWSIVIVILAAAVLIMIAIYCIITHRRAQKIGVLKVKYPVWGGNTALSAFVVMLGVIMIVMSALTIPKTIAEIADYNAHIADSPELYSWYIEKTENSLARDKSYLACWIVLVVMELVAIFKSGAYITKDGVMEFDGMKPQKTAARIENGAINFYVGKKKQRYIFELPETDENKELFKDFITSQTTEAED